MRWLRMLRGWVSSSGPGGYDPRSLRERLVVFIGFRKDW
jgi:hypothetical protein